MTSYVEDKNGVIRKRKTHCKHGHEFTPECPWATNRKGYSCRVCLVCQRDRMRRKRQQPGFNERAAINQATWRQAHPEENRCRYMADHAKKKKILDDARAKGCSQCSEKDLACLDFHHRDPSEKEGNIAEFRRYAVAKLLAEIAKCDVLCANCHRKHHRDERQTKSEPVSAHL